MKLGDECMNELTNRHLLIIGQTGSGKTTSTLTLLDQLQSSSQANIVLDPTGEYAQLPNASFIAWVRTLIWARRIFGCTTGGGVGTARRTSGTAAASAVNDLRIQNNLRNQSGCYQRISQPIAAHQQELEKLGRWSNHMPFSCCPTS